MAAQAVRPLGANARVSAHGGDPVVIAQGRAGLPAVANLLVLVAQRGSSRWLACA
jgi:hypothetical protein